MVQLNSTVPAVKVFILGMIFSMVVVTVVNGGYLGLRYGKREPIELAGRVFQRSSNGVRNIQARSGERRFYPGTRFGGKRSSLQSTPIVNDNAALESQDLPSPNIPYDCFYIPFVGVRCTRPEESHWNNRIEEGRQQQQAPGEMRGGSVVSSNANNVNNPGILESSRNSF